MSATVSSCSTCDDFGDGPHATIMHNVDYVFADYDDGELTLEHTFPSDPLDRIRPAARANGDPDPARGQVSASAIAAGIGVGLGIFIGLRLIERM